MSLYNLYVLQTKTNKDPCDVISEKSISIPKASTSLFQIKNMSMSDDNGVFPKWSRTPAEFSEFRETDKSLKHELGSI